MGTCEREGCDGDVRRHQTRCDDCIVAEARRRTRRREETESGIRGGQGRSGAEVEQSALMGAVAIAAGVLLVVVLLAVSLFNAGQEAGRTERAAETALRSGSHQSTSSKGGDRE